MLLVGPVFAWLRSASTIGLVNCVKRNVAIYLLLGSLFPSLKLTSIQNRQIRCATDKLMIVLSCALIAALLCLFKFLRIFLTILQQILLSLYLLKVLHPVSLLVGPSL